MRLGILSGSRHLLPFLFLALTVGDASAVKEKILHNFVAHPRGWEPKGELTADTSGNFYGTTYYGGAQEMGTVFKLTPTSSGRWTESVLYSFKGGSDGHNPMVGVHFDRAGNLYGTTYAGGAAGNGTVFQLKSGASDTWTESVIYSFTGGADGRQPLSGISVDASGNLYGTSTPSNGQGSPLFKLSPGSTGWTFSILHSFEGDVDGLSPSGSLVFDKAGNIYGTTQLGGPPTGNYGTVYELSPLSGGGWTEEVLYTFEGGTDGGQPVAGVILDNAGNLYGTTTIGGIDNSACPAGCGTVFELSPNGGGAWAETVLHSFSAGSDGESPDGGLIFDTAGSLYGTTMYGGENSLCSFWAGCGVVFELRPESGGQWTEQILASFASAVTSTGIGTTSPLLSATPIFDQAGNLYGTTTLGGTSNTGTIFKLTPGSGGKWKKVYAYVFGIADGSEPNAVVFDASGNLYGNTQSGGTYGNGAVFELKPNSNGSWTRSLLYSFRGTTDGASPLGPLVFDSSGNLYGTTNNGGNSACNSGTGCGVVFKLTPSSKGEWTESVLHAFGGSDGFQPFGGVVLDAAGNLYGTTFYGGSNCPSLGCGTVFELSPSGGTWTETVIHSFGASSSDGAYPEAGLSMDPAGNLYGTTESGGSGYFGTVFELAPSSNGQWTETILHAFSGYPSDGAYPFAGVVLDAAGNVYGITGDGGNGLCGSSTGCGTLFELTASAGGQWTENILRDFSLSGSDGYYPWYAPALDSAGNLYGVTSLGANSACSGYGCGAVFKLSSGSGGQWTETVLHTFLGSPSDGQGGGPLILDPAGNLYGPSGGGTAGDGVIFEIP